MAATTINNPMANIVVDGDEAGEAGASYEGKYGSAVGPNSTAVTLKTGGGDMDDAVQILSAKDGEVVATIPYRELYTFHVITGEGPRKPSISFEHKPDKDSQATVVNHVRPTHLSTRSCISVGCSGLTSVAPVRAPQRVWMDGPAATSCAENLLAMLKELELEFGSPEADDG